MFNSKFFGGILLIIGTSIGGGMLALPVATASVGFVNSLIFLILCWIIMTIGALLILEVNMQLPIGSNMISMAKATLGLPGQIIGWITYLLLLYALISAYISGGSDVLQQLMQRIHISLPNWITSIIFTMLFGAVVYNGINAVISVNRILMLGKFGVYILLILVISPYIKIQSWLGGTANTITSSIMVLITSFGFASIIPSLREYLHNDLVLLRKLVIIGSLIPLICYILWDAVIMGVIPRHGVHGLMVLNQTDHATSGLNIALNAAVNSHIISGFFNFFTSICMITAFLGVSIGLFDFLADGCKLQKTGIQKVMLCGFTFLPPLIIVLMKPGIYLHALSYAGICCIILLLLLPIIMAWSARVRSVKTTQNIKILVGGGYPFLVIILLIAMYLLCINIK